MEEIHFDKESKKVPQVFQSTWHKMRELVMLSLNIIFIKDTLQLSERLYVKLEYMNFSVGSVFVTQSDLRRRKRHLNRRVKDLLEDILNSSKINSNFAFNIYTDSASLTKKQLEKGYALYSNIRDITYALNLRNGSLLPILNPEMNIVDPNLSSLEYTAQHDGPVYKYFEINETDPLKNELRY